LAHLAVNQCSAVDRGEMPLSWPWNCVTAGNSTGKSLYATGTACTARHCMQFTLFHTDWSILCGDI